MDKNTFIARALESKFGEIDRSIEKILQVSSPIVFIVGLLYGMPVLTLSSIVLYNMLFTISLHYTEDRRMKNIFICACFSVFLMMIVAITRGLVESRYLYFVILILFTLYQSSFLINLGSVIAYVFTISIFFLPTLNAEHFLAGIIRGYLLWADDASTEKFMFSIGSEITAHLTCLLTVSVLYKNTYNSLSSQFELQERLTFFNRNQVFADEIAQGNLDLSYELQSGDVLGESLVNMRENLKIAAGRDYEDRFVSQGLTEIGEILRQYTDDMSLLTESLLTKLTRYLKANQSALYLVEGEAENNTHLKMAACFAYDRKKYLQKRIEIGDGIVGQAYLERLPVFLTKLPPKYLHIGSGLGSGTPACVLIVPMIGSEKVVGILEIASFEVLADYERRFVERIAENIAVSIINVKNNEETKKLYIQSQIATEELRAREEEMRQNMEELQATQEAMEYKQLEIEQKNQMLEANEKSMQKVLAEFKAQTEALRQREKDLSETETKFQIIIDNIPRAIFWKDVELRFLGCNKIFAQIAGLATPKDIVGKTDYDMPWAKADSDAYRADDRYVIDNHQPKIDIEESQTNDKGEQSWNLTTKVPLFDADNKCFAILGMFEDITERKQQVIKLKADVDNLRYIYQEFEQTKVILEQIKAENNLLRKGK